uniref:1-phosphatidylinositol phosphodiesterase-like n=1 Tax=Geotrypetes seraphini TaxID=260995 RepID=A0A6P8RDE8_GEOSA|nr:1-phosphatidylinositol phosphodiesterase-like [Geotrypetes seraphini]
MGNIQRREFDTTESPADKNPDWMSSLPDERLLSDLSIPGTHRSMSLFGGNTLQCQSWNLKAQYEAGIRFVDIRCRHYYDKLAIHHGEKFLYCHFTQVLYDTISFLREHPKEVVLMHVKEEYEASNNTSTFSDLVSNHMEKVEKSWFWESSAIPTLGQVRRKIVILQDFNDSVMGIPYSSLAAVEELHVPSLDDIDWKWSTIEESLKAAENGNSDKMYLTYCSGASKDILPCSVAEKINYDLLIFLEDKGDKKSRFGIIALDFPGCVLLHKIITSN